MFRAVPPSIIRSFSLYTQQWYMSYMFADILLAGSGRVCLCVQWKTPDDGQRNCPKHVEFYSKNKFEKLVHLVGFIIRIYQDARSPERQETWSHIFEKNSSIKFNENPHSGRWVAPCGWKHGQTWQLTVTFCNFVNTPNNGHHTHISGVKILSSLLNQSNLIFTKDSHLLV